MEQETEQEKVEEKAPRRARAVPAANDAAIVNPEARAEIATRFRLNNLRLHLWRRRR